MNKIWRKCTTLAPLFHPLFARIALEHHPLERCQDVLSVLHERHEVEKQDLTCFGAAERAARQSSCTSSLSTALNQRFQHIKSFFGLERSLLRIVPYC